MDWNNAMKIALREARLKRELTRCRVDMFYVAQDELGDYTNYNFGYLIDCLNDWSDQYRNNNEFNEANQLSEFIKEYKSDDYEEWELSSKITDFFEYEWDFYNNLIDRYNRILSVDKTNEPKSSQRYLPMYHEKHGWAQNWYL